ncbi:hypothetical protein PHYBOEH_001520 [Phytophthora boehmeriae]|uniref:Uncharacterized protein n=1 Tax=Phytophthora boehmeriae TaxID=109152 RepID=A0A8T1WYZ1_9STRA|nr:hypothetical protein PHYBOEH_001520 [Phytophthora boehmeriae]
MFLLNNLEIRMTELMRLHQELVGQITRQENRVTTAPTDTNKVHGFALTINPMPEGAHEIRFIAGQEKYVTREAAGAAGLLFDFTETGNPIDLRQNFQRKANARLRARVGAYLRNHPDETAPDIVFRCCRSKWVDNTPFPLEEVADILTELSEETNVAMRLVELYTEVHSQIQDYIRIQRFSLAP